MPAVVGFELLMDELAGSPDPCDSGQLSGSRSPLSLKDRADPR